MTERLSDLAAAEERRAAVQASAADLLAREWSLAKLRSLVEGGGPVHAGELWDGMRRLEWDRIDPFAFASEKEDALGVAELCAIVEETGRAMAPTPLVPCVVGRAILRATGASTTAELPVLAHREPDRTSDRLHAGVRVTESDGVFRLTGTKCFVPYGVEADAVILSTEGGLFVADPHAEGLRRTSLGLLDGSPCAEIRLDDVALLPAARIASGADAERILRDALDVETLARCAELVGVATRALELAVDYAKERVAFDRPIGSFQAVQHRLVNLRGHVEIARALVQGAARAAAGERAAAVSMAAFAALDDLRKVPEGALQVFGGVGTTWEHDIHFFLKRAATLTSLLGERASFREDVVRHFEIDGR